MHWGVWLQTYQVFICVQVYEVAVVHQHVSLSDSEPEIVFE